MLAEKDPSWSVVSSIGCSRPLLFARHSSSAVVRSCARGCRGVVSSLVQQQLSSLRWHIAGWLVVFSSFFNKVCVAACWLGRGLAWSSHSVPANRAVRTVCASTQKQNTVSSIRRAPAGVELWMGLADGLTRSKSKSTKTRWEAQVSWLGVPCACLYKSERADERKSWPTLALELKSVLHTNTAAEEC